MDTLLSVVKIKNTLLLFILVSTFLIYLAVFVYCHDNISDNSHIGNLFTCYYEASAYKWMYK